MAVPGSVHGGKSHWSSGASCCWTVGGLRVAQAVTAAVLEALQPAGVQAAFTALERVETAHDTPRQA
jgi:hypothetical protein